MYKTYYVDHNLLPKRQKRKKKKEKRKRKEE